MKFYFLSIDWSSSFTWVLFGCALLTAALSYKGLFSSRFVPYLESQDTRERLIFILSLITLIFTQFKSCADDNTVIADKKAFNDTLSVRETRYNHNLDSASNKLSFIQDSLNKIIEHKTDTLKTLQLSTKDSIQNAIDSSYQHSVAASNKALAVFGIVLQDSLRALKVKSNNGELSLAPIINHPVIFTGFEDSVKVLNIQFVSGDGTVYNIQLYYYIILHAQTTKDLKGVATIKFAKNDLIDSGRLSGLSTILPTVRSTRFFNLNNDLNEQKNVLIIIKGTFSVDRENMEAKNFILSFFYDFKNDKILNFIEIPYY